MIGEDPPTNPVGADVWLAASPHGNDDDNEAGKRRQSSETVRRFASLKDCIAESSGIYFAIKGTEKFSQEIGLEDVVNGASLFDHRQQAGQGSPIDQLVAFAPVDGERDDHDDDDGGGQRPIIVGSTPTNQRNGASGRCFSFLPVTAAVQPSMPTASFPKTAEDGQLLFLICQSEEDGNDCKGNGKGNGKDN